MNCRSFLERMVELLDTCPDPEATFELLEHSRSCPECARELARSQALVSALGPSRKTIASGDLKERIMNKVTELESVQSQRRVSPLRRRVTRLALASVVLAAVALGGSRFTSKNSNGFSPAMQILVQAAEAAENLRTMHIQARMRTIPHDNFDLIMPDEDFVPVDIWTSDANPPKWRVEKPERVVVMDGKTTVGIIRPKSENALVFSADRTAPGLIGWLAPLLDVDSLLVHEQSVASDQDSKVTVEEKGDSTILTIRAKAQGNFSESDYSRNKSILESDNTRVYTFNTKTHRLEGMRVFIDKDGEQVLVFEITGISYDQALAASLFRPEVPEGATWYKTPDEIEGTQDNSFMTPKEAAEALFTACADEDWVALRGYAGTLADKPDFRDYLRGLKIISIGEPFKSGMYGGWFVPYEIRLKSGEVKKFKLAIRNDNPKRQWTLDGGI